MESQKIRFEKEIKQLNEYLDGMEFENKELQEENEELQEENKKLKMILNNEVVVDKSYGEKSADDLNNICISSASESE